MQTAAVALKAATPFRPIPIRDLSVRAPSSGVAKCPTHCSNCGLREMCLPCGLSGAEVDRLDELIYTRKRVKRGESLYEAGDVFKSLYAIRSGFFKSTVLLEDGRDQVTGFHMPGELMGFDGIGAGQHGAGAVALEDSEVCVILFESLENAASEMRALQQQFHKVMSRELVRDQGLMMLLGTMRADERLASFLLNLAQRFLVRGYSQTEFNLRMTRDEIGSYLGLKLETVSRAFSRFQELGLLVVQQKSIRIVDAAGLKSILGA